jgi:hypothetical protein
MPRRSITSRITADSHFRGARRHRRCYRRSRACASTTATVGLCTLKSAVNPQLETDRFLPLNLSCEKPVSKAFASTCNLYCFLHHVGDKALRHLTLALEKHRGLAPPGPPPPPPLPPPPHPGQPQPPPRSQQPGQPTGAGAGLTATAAPPLPQHPQLTPCPLPLPCASSSASCTPCSYSAPPSSSVVSSSSPSSQCIIGIGRSVDLAPQLPRGLTRLSLAGNLIGDAGAAHMGRALAANRALTWLNLSWNRIGSSGAAALAEAGLSPG